MKRVSIGLGEDSNTRYGEIPTGTNAANRNLTTVGNEDVPKMLHYLGQGGNEVYKISQTTYSDNGHSIDL